MPLSQLLKLKPEEVLVESTGVIGQRIKKVIYVDIYVCGVICNNIYKCASNILGKKRGR